MSFHEISPFPFVKLDTPSLPIGGVEIATPTFCRKQYSKDSRCSDFYRQLAGAPDGFHQCPFGFGCYKLTYSGLWAWSGLIFYPRFGTAAERERAATAPESKVSRETVEHQIKLLLAFEQRLSAAYDKRIKEAPPAFHELRKLNRTIKQGAESLKTTYPEDDSVRKIHGASELLSNQFDILELLASEEILKSPTTHNKQLEAVIFKCAKILEERAIQRGMNIEYHLTPGIAKIHPKSFPIVPSVLIDNAIRYATPNTTIVLRLDWFGTKFRFSVQNDCTAVLPAERLFVKGSRLFPGDSEGSGLGLYLVKQIAKQHGGTARFEQLKGGVIFVVEALVFGT